MITRKQNITITEYDSSWIFKSEYNEELEELILTFKNGIRYKYYGVASTIFNLFDNAESQGKAFNSFIRGYHDFDKIEKMKRYIVRLNNKEIGQADTISGICRVIGCSRQWYYKKFDGKHLPFNKELFQIIDVVSYYNENKMQKYLEN